MNSMTLLQAVGYLSNMANKRLQINITLLLVASSFLYTSQRLYNPIHFGIIGKKILWDFDLKNIILSIKYDFNYHYLLKFIFFFFVGFLLYIFLSVFRVKTIAGFLISCLLYIVAIEIENLLFNSGIIFLDISNWFIYLIGISAGFFVLHFLIKWIIQSNIY